MSDLTCHHCAEPVVSGSRGGWSTLDHASGRTDHRVAIRVEIPQPAGPPVPHIVDHGGHFATYVDDRIEGRPWRLLATTPTGRGAVYQEARDRRYAEGLASARVRAARYSSEPIAVESCCDLGICLRQR